MFKKVGKFLIALAIIFTATFFLYANDYYRATEEAVMAYETLTMKVGTNSSDVGFIIYPGGKVDERAYSLLAQEIMDRGFYVEIVSVPLHLSIFDSNKAENVIKTHMEIKEWVIIGHSLGGTSASIYAKANPKKIKGIVFLGSYPYKDLSDLDLFTLTITGSNDQVLNAEKAEKSKDFYPKNAYFEIIDGGNHAGFGSYGDQKGDGIATITVTDQIEETVNLIFEYLN